MSPAEAGFRHFVWSIAMEADPVRQGLGRRAECLLLRPLDKRIPKAQALKTEK